MKYIVVAILTILIPLLVIGQQTRSQKKSPASEEGSNLPCTTIKGIQATSIPDSEGGGEHVYLQVEDGIIGPFQKLPALPRGIGYGSTEVEVPPAPTSPCQRGNWAKDDHFLYMCVSIASESTGASSIWKRIPFDRSWTPDALQPAAAKRVR